MTPSLHDDLLARYERLVAVHNPCRREGGTCLVPNLPTCCIHTRFKRDDGDLRCPYLGPSGCQNENLECKLWFCRSCLEVMDPEVKRILYSLEAEAKAAGLIGRPYLGERYIDYDRF